MPGPLQASFRKRLRKLLRKAHGGAYQSITDEPPARPTTPRLGADPYAKPKPKPKPPVKKHDTPKSPHKEHDPRYRQGAGQAVHAGKIHHELAAIFKGENEGAGFMQNAPRPGFNISIAGDRQDIGKRFEQLEDVEGVWEGQREKSWMANLPQQSNPYSVVKQAAMAGRANDQDAVFVRYDGRQSPGGGPWNRAMAYVVQTPLGIIDVVDSSPPFSIKTKNLEATIKMAKRFGGGQVQRKHVWTRLLEKGKHY